MSSIVVAILLAVAMVSCSTPGLVVQKQVTGPGTNCYLLYDPISREAALIDPGGPIDSLLATVQREQLQVRYFLFTHGHFDHVIGLPAVRDSFPDALVCLDPLEFRDMKTQKDWAISHFGEEFIVEWLQDPELKKVIEFDLMSFGIPDLFLVEGQLLDLGSYQIRVLSCPGHSAGGTCYAVADLLFSGDVLFKGTVGRVDTQNGSREEQIASVRRLYRELPDQTIVYPGHEESTTIGAERIGNERVSETAVSL